MVLMAKEIRLRKVNRMVKMSRLFILGRTPAVLTSVEIDFLIAEVYQIIRL
jgi:hypothetical protein